MVALEVEINRRTMYLEVKVTSPQDGLRYFFITEIKEVVFEEKGTIDKIHHCQEVEQVDHRERASGFVSLGSDRTWWLLAVVPARWRLSQQGGRFETSLGYVVKTYVLKSTQRRTN